jgi:hypothetical protein
LFRTALKSNENGPLRKSVALSVYFAVGSISPCVGVSLAVLEAMIFILVCVDALCTVGPCAACGRGPGFVDERSQVRPATSGVVTWLLYVGFFFAGRWGPIAHSLVFFIDTPPRGSRCSRKRNEAVYQRTARRDCKFVEDHDGWDIYDKRVDLIFRTLGFGWGASFGGGGTSTSSASKNQRDEEKSSHNKIRT